MQRASNRLSYVFPILLAAWYGLGRLGLRAETCHLALHRVASGDMAALAMIRVSGRREIRFGGVVKWWCKAKIAIVQSWIEKVLRLRGGQELQPGKTRQVRGGLVGL